jgi:hypothetical protein
MNKAVITGDIVGFTKVNVEEREILINNTKAIFREWTKEKGRAEFFRGDSFQLLFEDVNEALYRGVQLRCWFKKTRTTEQQALLDAKISIGIGDVSYFGESVLDADGEAFHLSGRTFDKMEESRLRISVGNERIDLQLEVIADLMNVIINDWTSAQSEVIYLLLQNKTQQQMADELGIAQSAVNNRLKLSKWKEIEKTIKYLSLLINDSF